MESAEERYDSFKGDSASQEDKMVKEPRERERPKHM